MKYIILISGKLQQGKNTLANFLIEDFKSKNLNVHTDLFARGVKDGAKEDFRSMSNYLNRFVEGLRSVINSTYDVKFRDGGNQLSYVNLELDKLKLCDENFYEDKTELSRIILQLYGTDIFRNRVDSDWWAKKLKERILKSDADISIITDVRFENEIEVFSEINSEEIKVITIRVNRGTETKSNVSQHQSETALDNWNEWNYVVENLGSLEELKNSASIVVKDILCDEYIKDSLF